MTTTKQDETAVCGPGCACGTPSGSGRLKIMVSLIVLLAVAGIFIYKTVAAKDNTANNTVAKDSAAFGFAEPSPNAVPEAATQSSATATPDTAKAGQRVGEYLESLSALNDVAADQDVVFIFVPAPKGELADDKTNTAVLAAQRTLKSNKIKLGLYTLPTRSPDYATISAQVQAPAILVASKGGGMAAVAGDVTETKLLQAFMATSRAGCGAGCGPSNAGCN